MSQRCDRCGAAFAPDGTHPTVGGDACARIAALEAEVARLRAALGRAMETWRRVEWMIYTCPVCAMDRSNGHRPGCSVAAVLTDPDGARAHAERQAMEAGLRAAVGSCTVPCVCSDVCLVLTALSDRAEFREVAYRGVGAGSPVAPAIAALAALDWARGKEAK